MDDDKTSKSDEKTEEMGFKFGNEVEGLKIYRTIEEIERHLKEHKEELERDKQEIEKRGGHQHNKYMRDGKYQNGNYQNGNGNHNSNYNTNSNRNGYMSRQ